MIRDDLEGFQGPLAGISKALKVCSTPYLLVFPCDSPLIDAILIDSLIEKMEATKADICVAHDGSIMHALSNHRGQHKYQLSLPPSSRLESRLILHQSKDYRKEIPKDKALSILSMP